MRNPEVWLCYQSRCGVCWAQSRLIGSTSRSGVQVASEMPKEGPDARRDSRDGISQVLVAAQHRLNEFTIGLSNE